MMAMIWMGAMVVVYGWVLDAGGTPWLVRFCVW